LFSENLLDSKSKELLETAKYIAQQRGDSLVDTDHLLTALLKRKYSPLVKVLEKRGIDTKDLTQKIDEYLNDLYQQVDSSIKEYVDYIKSLQNQLKEVRSNVLAILKELKRVESAKAELAQELRYERDIWGGFGSRAQREYEKLARYEQQLKSQLSQIEKSLLQLADRVDS